MKNMTLHHCAIMNDGKSHCSILISEDASFFVPIILDNAEGAMVHSFLVGDEIEDSVLDNVLFIPESWKQLESNMIAVELDFSDERTEVLAKICVHQKNEVKNKFTQLVTPMGYALIYSSHFSLPLYVDDCIVAQDRREINQLESYLNNI